MKTCTNCHQKKKNFEFVEDCGGTKILNFMCKACRENARITQRQADNLIKNIAHQTGERI